MLSGYIKSKIYIAISVFVILIIVISLVMAIDFFIKINVLVFNVDEKMIGEKTTALDLDAYNKIKSKFEINNLTIGR